MNWLFWKEFRQNRVVVITLLLALVVPHLFGLCGMWYDWHLMSIRGVPWHLIRQHCLAGLFGVSYFSLAISQVALALIGGNAIAGERADRSAEFQVYLPLTRRKILAGKLLLVFAIAAAVWLINPLILWSTSGSATPGDRSQMPVIMLNMATTGVVFFCVAWFFSSILRSPTFSFAAGLAAPLIVISLIVYPIYLLQGIGRGNPEIDRVIKICYVCISLAVALPSFGFGTWLYLRRVEP